MQRFRIATYLAAALLAAVAAGPIVEAQQDNPSGQDNDRPGRRGDGEGRGRFRGGFGGGFGFGGPGLSGSQGGAMAELRLLRLDAVRKEVKLTEDQQELVRILGDEVQEARPDSPANFREMSEEERREFGEKMREWGEEQTAQVRDTLKTILEEPQQKRLREIAIQQQGISALLNEEVKKELALTPEQVTKLEETQNASREEMGQVMREAFRDGGSGDRDAMREKMDAARKATEEKMLSHLTEDQKAEFTSLKGEAFELPQEAFGFGRGGRGRGPGGPGGGDRGRPRRPE